MIKIVCFGKIKEKYLVDSIKDYETRINKYHKLNIIELKDSNLKEEEKELILNIKDNEYLILLDIEGKEMNSIQFSEKIEKYFTSGLSNITFIIGSSYGVSDKIKNLCNERISFSKLTFPHGLFRLILLEQIYRSFKIINNETYHK